MSIKEDEPLSIIELQKKEYSVFEIIGIAIAVTLSIPVFFILILFIWQIFIAVGLDVAPR